MRRVRHRDAVIAAGRGHHTGSWNVPRQQVGEGAARLERSGMLQELQLEGEGVYGEAEVGSVQPQQRVRRI